MRYHSLVFSISLGVPAVSIDYTLGRGKVKALADKYNVPQMSLKKTDSKFLVEQLSDILEFKRFENGHIREQLNLKFKGAMKTAVSNIY